MEDILREMNPWWEKEIGSQGIKRDYTITGKGILILTGLRRVGKTTILKQKIKELIEQGTPPKNICYISVDHIAFQGKKIYELINTFKKINNIKEEKTYLFLDEVTTRKDANTELKNLYDMQNYEIYASSSSASELKDSKAELTGRATYIEIEPLTFQEFLRFKEYTDKQNYMQEKYFEEYMKIGGLPEYVLTNDPAYINNLVQNILYKDIIAKHNIRDETLVIDIFRTLCERVGKQLTYSKIARIVSGNKETVRRIVEFFIQTYLFHTIEKKGKLNEKIKSPKKIYCADVGIKNNTTGYRDKGAIFENLVFLKIKKEQPEYIKQDEIEIDFCYGDTLIEAKFKRGLNEKQEKLFKQLKYKHKIIAQDFTFFTKQHSKRTI